MKLTLCVLLSAPLFAQTDWPVFLGDSGGTRYTALSDINPGNVANLKVAADGTATVYSPYVSGKLCAIHYIKTDFATGVDFTITAEATGQTLWAQNDADVSTVVMPRTATHTTAGVAALYAAAAAVGAWVLAWLASRGTG
jgi:glucose dehydrogenase